MDTPTHEQIARAAHDAVIASAASKATYTGASATFFSWIVSSEAGVAFGILLGTLGLIVNLIFSLRRDRREQRIAEHTIRMSTLKDDHSQEAP